MEDDTHAPLFARSIPLNLRREVDWSNAEDRLALVLESLDPYVDFSAMPPVDKDPSHRPPDLDRTLAALANMPEHEMMQELGRLLYSQQNPLAMKRMLVSHTYQQLNARVSPKSRRSDSRLQEDQRFSRFVDSNILQSPRSATNTTAPKKRRQCHLL